MRCRRERTAFSGLVLRPFTWAITQLRFSGLTESIWISYILWLKSLQ